MEMLQHRVFNDPQLLMMAAGGFVFVIVIGIWWRSHARKKFENQLKQVIKTISVDYRRNVHIPDGMGGSVYIHYMILTHYGIILLNVQNYPGNIFGGEKIDLWTQMYKGKSYKFENPLNYNNYCLQSVKQIINDAPVRGQVVFTNAGEFPKGKPEGVSLTFELLDYIESTPRLDVIPDALQKNWNRLKTYAK